ncbi:MAG: hypothetical protein EHM72_17440 [Calditrichaeota bacterium]|nr:MAG: hypothetical protein EHM72_17440 [Calditrichota bacterium]
MTRFHFFKYAFFAFCIALCHCAGQYQNDATTEEAADDFFADFLNPSEEDAPEPSTQVTSSNVTQTGTIQSDKAAAAPSVAAIENEPTPSSSTTSSSQAAVSTPPTTLKAQIRNSNAQSENSAVWHDCKVVLTDEKKLPFQNRLHLVLTAFMQQQSPQLSKWKPLANADIESDNELIQTQFLQPTTDANGRINVLLSPKNDFEYFSFVPLEATGFQVSNYSIPVEALSIYAVNFYFFSNGRLDARYSFPYQTYDLRNIIRSFVEETMKSHVRTVKIRVLDIESQYPIEKAEVTLSGHPPTPWQLLHTYFSERTLLDEAMTHCADYVLSSRTISTRHDGADFSLYQPFTYRMEVIHPDYQFTAQDLFVDDRSDVINIFATRIKPQVKILQDLPQVLRGSSKD